MSTRKASAAQIGFFGLYHGRGKAVCAWFCGINPHERGLFPARAVVRVDVPFGKCLVEHGDGGEVAGMNADNCLVLLRVHGLARGRVLGRVGQHRVLGRKRYCFGEYMVSSKSSLRSAPEASLSYVKRPSFCTTPNRSRGPAASVPTKSRNSFFEISKSSINGSFHSHVANRGNDSERGCSCVTSFTKQGLSKESSK